MNSLMLKTLRDRRRSLLWWVVGIFGYLFAIGALYPLIADMQEELETLIEAYPEGILAIMGASSESDMFDPEGFLQVEATGWVVPLVFAFFGAAMGARAVAGEEEDGTIDLLLATPLTRSRLVLEKMGALVLALGVLGLTVFASILVDSLLFDMNIPPGNIAALSLLAVLLGAFFGALAMALSSGTGRRGLSLGFVSLLTAGTYLINSLAEISEILMSLQAFTPFYYYESSEPLRHGLEGGHAGVLAGASVVFMGIGMLAIRRRDLGVGGIRLPVPRLRRAAG